MILLLRGLYIERNLRGLFPKGQKGTHKWKRIRRGRKAHINGNVSEGAKSTHMEAEVDNI
jgi:hypothetical protein